MEEQTMGVQGAAEEAGRRGVKTVALLGKGGGELAGRCDVQLIVESGETARIQEAHQVVMHVVLERVDRVFA